MSPEPTRAAQAGDDADGALLLPGTALVRAELTDWLVRVLAPVAALTAELDEIAETLASLPPVTEETLSRPALLRRHATATTAAQYIVGQRYDQLVNTRGWRDSGRGPLPRVSDALGPHVLSLASQARFAVPTSSAGRGAYGVLFHSALIVADFRPDALGLLHSGAQHGYALVFAKLVHDEPTAALDLVWRPDKPV